MRKSDKVLTEAYRNKRYEEDLTRFYFEAMRDIQRAETLPTIEWVRVALASASTFTRAVVFSKHHLREYHEKVIPTLRDIRKILYGDPRIPSVNRVAQEYGARIEHIRNKPELHNGMALIEQIHEAVFLVKQWAYEEGLFLPKPFDRKFGLEAIEESLEM